VDLRALIPAAESLAEPLSGVLGDGASGLSGLVGQIESLDPGASASALGSLMEGSFDSALPAAGSGPFAVAVGTLGNLSGQIAEIPDDLLSGVQEPLRDLDGIVRRLPELLGPLSEVADAIEAARNGNLGPVLSLAGDALRAIANAATGADFAEFGDWTAYLRELADTIRPIVAAGGTPDEVRDALLALALDRARETVLGLAPQLTAVLDDVSPVLDDLLPDVPGLDLDTLRGNAVTSLQALQTDASTVGADLSTTMIEYQSRLFTLTDTLRVVLGTVDERLGHTLLTPGAVLDLASGEIDRVLSMQVSDFSNVQTRVEAFYGDIESALDQVDLSSVTGEITGFFQTIQDTLGTLDVGAIGGQLEALAAEVDRLVTQLETVVTSLTARIQQWLEELRSTLDGALANLGSFDADGRFTFFFQDELEQLFGRMDTLIQGDPARPGDFSVRGALGDLQAGLVQFIEQIEQALTALASELDAVKGQLATALEDVRAAIESVDPSSIMDQAKAGLERAFQEIGDLELDPLVDPVIAELEEARDALAQIDVSELNDLLRAALRAVLDAISTSDFDRELTRPLVREFDELLDAPRALLATFTDKFNELLDKLDAISPEALLAPVQEHLDRITSGLDVDLRALLEPPLNQALAGVRRQLERLDPGQLLGPVQSVFEDITGAVDSLDPARLLEPAQSQIDALAEAVRNLDFDRPLAGVNAVLGDMDRFLDDLDPTRLLQPLNEPFDAARATLDSLQPSTLLAPLTDIMDQLGDLTTSVPESVAEQARALFDEAMARIDSLNPEAVFDTVRAALHGLRSRLDDVGLPVLLHALQSEYNTTLAAVQAADARDGTAFATPFGALEPTRAFGSLIAQQDRIVASLRGTLDSLDPSSLEDRYQEARGRIDELLPRAIRDDITASQIQTLLELTDPSRLIGRLDNTYQRIVDQITAIDPGLLIGPLATVYQTLRDALATLDVAALTERIEVVLGRLAEVIEGVSLEALVAPILQGVDQLKEVVRALDPTPIVEALSERFAGLLDLLEEVSVRALVDRLQDSWDEVSGRIRSLFNLATLLEPLVAILEQIQELLGGIDIGELVGVINDKIDKLRDELEEALNRSGDAFKAMIAAVPV
jgi:ElaB/YqjD/DUF883 family membrane-anchored ribosome-binding protein